MYASEYVTGCVRVYVYADGELLHCLLARGFGTIGFESKSSIAIDANVAAGRDFWRESFVALVALVVDLLLDTATA